MKGYYKQVCDILREHGWWYDKPGKGSHEKWTNGEAWVLVPFNCYSRHTANGVLREAGIQHKL